MLQAVANLPKLSALQFTAHAGLTPAAAAVVASCSNLRRLTIKQLYIGSTQQLQQVLTTLCSMSSLIFLSVEADGNFGLNRILRKCSPHLRHIPQLCLYLTGFFDCDTDRLTTSLAALSNLQQLSLSVKDYRGTEIIDIGHLSTSLTRLEQLAVHNRFGWCAVPTSLSVMKQLLLNTGHCLRVLHLHLSKADYVMRGSTAGLYLLRNFIHLDELLLSVGTNGQSSGKGAVFRANAGMLPTYIKSLHISNGIINIRPEGSSGPKEISATNSTHHSWQVQQQPTQLQHLNLTNCILFPEQLISICHGLRHLQSLTLLQPYGCSPSDLTSALTHAWQLTSLHVQHKTHVSAGDISCRCSSSTEPHCLSNGSLQLQPIPQHMSHFTRLQCLQYLRELTWHVMIQQDDDTDNADGSCYVSLQPQHGLPVQACQTKVSNHASHQQLLQQPVALSRWPAQSSRRDIHYQQPQQECAWLHDCTAGQYAALQQWLKGALPKLRLCSVMCKQ